MWAAAAPRPPDDAPPAPGGLSRELRHLPAARARRRDDLQNLDQLMHLHERCLARLGLIGLRRGEGFAGDGDGLE